MLLRACCAAASIAFNICAAARLMRTYATLYCFDNCGRRYTLSGTPRVLR